MVLQQLYQTFLVLEELLDNICWQIATGRLPDWKSLDLSRLFGQSRFEDEVTQLARQPTYASHERQPQGAGSEFLQNGGIGLIGNHQVVQYLGNAPLIGGGLGVEYLCRKITEFKSNLF